MAARSSHNNKAFSLIELLLSISILSIGILFIIQAFSFSARATGLSCDKTAALLLAKDKMEEFGFFQETDGLKAQPQETQGTLDQFTWSASLVPGTETKLYDLLVRISWMRNRKLQTIDLKTLLR